MTYKQHKNQALLMIMTDQVEKTSKGRTLPVDAGRAGQNQTLRQLAELAET